jgi:hypothetical protein
VSQPPHAADDLLAYLHLCDRLAGHAPSAYRLLLDHGRTFGPARVARARALPQQCFRNALMRSLADRTLTYCEGYALHLIPTHHAWCVDAAGHVIETTWADPGTVYYGLAFAHDYVADHALATGYPGLLDNPNWRKARLYRDAPAAFLHPGFHPVAGPTIELT